MDRHPRWSPRIERNLAALGASVDLILDIKHLTGRLCARKPPSPRLKLSQRAEARLMSWFISPQDIYDLSLYLTALSDHVLGEDEARQERAKEQDRDRQQRHRDANRPAYNSYQRDLMSRRRQAEKEEREEIRENIGAADDRR